MLVGAVENTQTHVHHLKILAASGRGKKLWSRSNVIDDWTMEPWDSIAGVHDNVSAYKLSLSQQCISFFEYDAYKLHHVEFIPKVYPFTVDLLLNSRQPTEQNSSMTSINCIVINIHITSIYSTSNWAIHVHLHYPTIPYFIFILPYITLRYLQYLHLHIMIFHYRAFIASNWVCLRHVSMIF